MTTHPTATESTAAAPGTTAQPCRLALIGDGIDKSLAPAFHTIAGQLVGVDVSYELFPRTREFADDLPRFLVELAERGYRGVNITVPFKATAWKGTATPDPAVVTMGVANTLLLGRDGPTHANNTDFTGFKWAYRQHFGGASPGSVAVLGAGGVGTATATALVDIGATAIRIFDIVRARSQVLARSLHERNPDVEVTVAVSAGAAVDGVDAIVNGTPVGMYFQPGSPVDLTAIGGQRWIFDAIYSPVETELMQRAASVGLHRISGFDLFVGQAIDAFEIFTGHRLDDETIADMEVRMRAEERRRTF